MLWRGLGWGGERLSRAGREVAHLGRLREPLIEGRDRRGDLLGSENDTAVGHLQIGGRAQLSEPNRRIGWNGSSRTSSA